MPSLSTDSPKSPDSKDSVTAKKTITGFEEGCGLFAEVKVTGIWYQEKGRVWEGSGPLAYRIEWHACFLAFHNKCGEHCE
jgi:hypothetical protein